MENDPKGRSAHTQDSAHTTVRLSHDDYATVITENADNTLEIRHLGPDSLARQSAKMPGMLNKDIAEAAADNLRLDTDGYVPYD